LGPCGIRAAAPEARQNPRRASTRPSRCSRVPTSVGCRGSRRWRFGKLALRRGNEVRVCQSVRESHRRGWRRCAR
jgi:hypothetical protein